MLNPIRQAREARGWTSTRLNYELRQAAARAGVSTASQTSLRVMISQWENGHQTPDRSYQMLLQLAFDLPADALGFTVETSDDRPGDGFSSLVRRNVRQLEVSDSVLGYFRQQHMQHTLMDNIAGPGLVVDIASTQADQLRTLAERGPGRSDPVGGPVPGDGRVNGSKTPAVSTRPCVALTPRSTWPNGHVTRTWRPTTRCARAMCSPSKATASVR